MTVSIHGPAMAKVASTAMTLGMNERLASLIWVAAWKTLTIRPTTRVTSRTGDATRMVISSAVRPRVITLSGVMACLVGIGLIEALRQRAQQQIPAVHQDEQDDLEGQRDDGRRHHHHPHRHQDAGDDHVDD